MRPDAAFFRVIRAADYRRMPWKNGGGETAEIAVWPPEASLDGFAWRVSMAKVASSGPFSLFPGIDRTIAVIDGDGIVLSSEGLGERTLLCGAAPYGFPADIPTDGRLLGGPILDLNAMSRRGLCSHRMRMAGPGTGMFLPGDAAAVGIVCAAFGGLGCRLGAETAELGTLDCLVADPAMPVEIVAQRPWIEIVIVSAA